MVFKSWFEVMGLEKDPFCIKPSTDFTGREKELNELKQHIASGNIVLLLGANGSGKTSILKKLENDFSAEKFESIYLNLLDEIELQKHLKNFSSNGKKRILLIDEGEKLLLEQAEFLKKAFDENSFYSIVFSSNDKAQLNFSNSFRHRISETIKLNKLSNEGLKQLLEKRLTAVNPFSEQAVNFLVDSSNGNPRNLFLNAKKVCIKLNGTLSVDKKISLQECKEALKLASIADFRKQRTVKAALQNLTPLQQKLLLSLEKNSLSMKELSNSVGSSIGTIGKQLSILSLNSKTDYMKRKGIEKALIAKNKSGEITIYSLTREGKELLEN